MYKDLNSQTASKITEMIAQIRHDLRKPEATARMFVDLLDEIKDQPDQLEKWKRNLVASFIAPLNSLGQFEQFMDKYLLTEPSTAKNSRA